MSLHLKIRTSGCFENQAIDAAEPAFALLATAAGTGGQVLRGPSSGSPTPPNSWRETSLYLLLSGARIVSLPPTPLMSDFIFAFIVFLLR